MDQLEDLRVEQTRNGVLKGNRAEHAKWTEHRLWHRIRHGPKSLHYPV